MAAPLGKSGKHRAWTLAEAVTRTAEEVKEMLRAAHAAMQRRHRAYCRRQATLLRDAGNRRPSAVVHGRPLTGRPMTSLQSCPRRQCGSRMHRTALERANPMTFRPANFDPSIDKCLLVRYPSRQHFLAMMANDAYREALVHRYAGLERTILLQM